MKQDNTLAADFSGDLQTIQKLRSENAVVDEICKDLEFWALNFHSFQILNASAIDADISTSKKAIWLCDKNWLKS